MTASASDDDSLDRVAANQARLAFPTVHPMLQLEKPFFAVGVDVVTHRRSAQRDGFAQHFLHSRMQLTQLFPRERSSAPPRPNSGAEQRFVSINVPYPTQQFLVEQCALDGSFASPKQRYEALYLRLQRLISGSGESRRGLV